MNNLKFIFIFIPGKRTKKEEIVNLLILQSLEGFDNLRKTIFFILFLFLALPCYCLTTYFGPEVYYMKRYRAKGYEQTGRMDGLKAGFDRIKRYGWYIGGEYLYATGTLRGISAPLKSGLRKPIKLDVIDQTYEGRVGYTLQKTVCSPFFTPFIGYGHFEEISRFIPPTTSLLTYRDTFDYVSGGFLSGYKWCDLLSMGLNFKAEFMINTETHVAHVPRRGEVEMTMNPAIQMRVEIPMRLFPECCLSADIVPFYEFRHFGGRDGYPYNYCDTKFNLIGMRLAASYTF